MRSAMLALVAVCAAAPLVAQGHPAGPDPTHKVASNGAMPAGWNAFLDHAEMKVEDLKFVPMGKAFHATTGPAAIFYDPKNVAKGDFKLSSTFTQTRVGRYPEGYGLIFNGDKLADRDKQTYVYFIVRQDGKYMIKHRAGTAVHTIIDWKDSPAIQKPDASGKMTNTLTVEAKGPDLKYIINGTQVERQDHAHVGGDGVVGVRVNHNLDVHIADFGLKPAK
jgi:hypothetical protein